MMFICTHECGAIHTQNYILGTKNNSLFPRSYQLTIAPQSWVGLISCCLALIRDAVWIVLICAGFVKASSATMSL